MPTITQTQASGTIQTVLASELDSLASSTSVAALGGVITLTSTGYIEIEVQLLCTSTSNMTANTVVLIWLLRDIDGTHYEDGGASVIPARNPDLILPLRASNSQMVTKRCRVPPGTFKVLLQQQSGQTWLTGNTVKILPVTNQFA